LRISLFREQQTIAKVESLMKFRAFTPWKKRNREFSLSNYEPSLGKISIFTDTALSSIKKEPSQAETLQEEVTIDELQNEVSGILLILA
jgi:hypothetical protein